MGYEIKLNDTWQIGTQVQEVRSDRDNRESKIWPGTFQHYSSQALHF